MITYYLLCRKCNLLILDKPIDRTCPGCGATSKSVNKSLLSGEMEFVGIFIDKNNMDIFIKPDWEQLEANKLKEVLDLTTLTAKELIVINKSKSKTKRM